MSLLIFENIAKEFKNQKVLDGVNLRVERGDRVALIGPNGSGKTTMLKIAMGKEISDSGKVITARNIKVAYLSQDMQEIRDDNEGNKTALQYDRVIGLENKIRKIEKAMQSVVYGSKEYYKLMNSYSNLLTQYETIDGYTIESKIKRILMGLGVKEETLSIPINSLSGGEKMRVALARMLLSEPDLIILDEPTNHLDIDAMEWLEDFLKKFEGGVLFVSHDRYFLDRVSTRIAELENGTIIEKKCSYSSFIEQKNKLREYALREQKSLNWKLKNINKVNNELKSKGKIKAVKSREKTLNRMNQELKSQVKTLKEKEHLKKSESIKLQFKDLKKVSKDIIFVENFSKSFGNISLFNNASFHIRGGERIGIIGPNGCGKTTLIRIILKMDTDYEGLVRIGEWVKYSYLSQDINFENEERTIIEEILFRKEMSLILAREHLANFNFYGEEVDKKIEVLSGGEKVRLYLACIVLENSDCLILDEPTNHLDIQARESVENAINNFKGTVIAISHDRYYLNNCVDRILEVTSKGKIVSYEGNYDFYKQRKEIILDVDNKKVKELNVKKTNSNKFFQKDINKKSNRIKNNDNIENKIIILEEKIAKMEGSFDEETPQERYNEYAEMIKELDELYNIL